LKEHLKADSETWEHARKMYGLEKPKDLKEINLCPQAGSCAKFCLFTAGRGRMSNVRKGRIAKTLFYIYNRKEFDLALREELEKLQNQAIKGTKISVRLNGTQDSIKSEAYAKDFPLLTFYDYTKNANKFKRFGKGELPANYHLTFSYDSQSLNIQSTMGWILGRNEELKKQGSKLLTRAKVYHPSDYEKLKRNVKCIDGDEHDLRFLDDSKESYIVALKAKGEALKEVKPILSELKGA